MSGQAAVMVVAIRCQTSRDTHCMTGWLGGDAWQAQGLFVVLTLWENHFVGRPHTGQSCIRIEGQTN